MQRVIEKATGKGTWTCDWVIQKYVEPTHQINRLKWDVRMWAVITCEDPLTIYWYQDGYTRFTTRPFDMGQLEDPIAHVTNVEFQRESEEGIKAIDEGTIQWHTDALLDYLQARGEAHKWTEVRWSPSYSVCTTVQMLHFTLHPVW